MWDEARAEWRMWEYGGHDECMYGAEQRRARWYSVSASRGERHKTHMKGITGMVVEEKQ